MIFPNTPSAAWILPGLKYDNIPRESIILNEVCKYFKIDLYGLKMQNRKKELVYARHVAMYLIHKYTRLSISSIGGLFNRDHTTILYACKVVDFEIKHMDVRRMDVEEIERKLSYRIKI